LPPLITSLAGARRRFAPALAALLVAAGFAVLASPPPALLADAMQDRRAEIGVKLFRAMLAADLDLGQKPLSDGQLLLVFVYADDRARAEALAAAFRGASPEPIRGLPVLVETASQAELGKLEKRVPGGVFLTQPPDAAALRTLVGFGIANHVIVYSPFEGNVENGIAGGLAVEAQVRPYVNLATLAASHINLKEFFLKVAKVYR
jgi:hypothetical protein